MQTRRLYRRGNTKLRISHRDFFKRTENFSNSHWLFSKNSQGFLIIRKAYRLYVALEFIINYGRIICKVHNLLQLF